MSKHFMPDSRGGMSLRTPPLGGTTTVNAFRVPSSSVAKLDRVLAGGPPSICVVRCLDENTLIHMGDGSLKQIRTISPGEIVFNGSGLLRRVKNVFDNGNTNKLISIKTSRTYRPIVCTPNHQFLVLDLRGRKKHNLSYYLQQPEIANQVKWLPASELTTETYLLTPLEQNIFQSSSSKIDLACFAGKHTYIKEKTLLTPGQKPVLSIKEIAELFGTAFWKVAEVSNGRCKGMKKLSREIKQFLQTHQQENLKQISRFIPFSYATGLLFGAFLGDGTSRERKGKGGEIRICLNSEHPEQILLIEKTLESLFGVKAHHQISAKSKGVDLVIYSVLLGRFFNQFGKATEKHLPVDYLVSNPEYLLGILDGLQLADGSLTTSVCNTSPYILNLCYQIIEKLGGNPKIYLEKGPRASLRKDGHVIKGRYIAGYVRQLINKKNNNEEIDKIPGFRLSKITKKEKVETITRVYDLEIEGDNPSFIAHNVVVHNSQGGIGDVLMTLPTVKALKFKYNAQIDYATDFEYLGGALPKVLQGNPHIASIVDFSLMDKSAYNAVIDLTCPCIMYEKPHVAPLNRIDLFARHAGLHIPMTDPKIDYTITEEEKAWANEWVASHGLQKFKLIMVNPNSSTTRRDAPQKVLQHALGRLMQTFAKTHRGIVVLHGNQTTDVNWKLAGTQEMRDYDIRRIAAIMNLCDLVICPDSALLHMASALGVKTLTLFGPTDPRARINYFPQAQAIWFRCDLACAPCVVGTTPVLTKQGYKPISSIKVGESVLTSSGQFLPVTELHQNPLGQRQLLSIKAMGLQPIEVTEDHKVLVKRTPKNEWIPAGQVKRGDYLCIPRLKTEVSFGDYRDDPDFCWLLGYFVAEGYLKTPSKNSRAYTVNFAIGDTEMVKILPRLQEVYSRLFHKHFATSRNKGNVSYHPNSRGKSTILTIGNKKLVRAIQDVFEAIHPKAISKQVPAFLFMSSPYNITQFLAGACTGDDYNSPTRTEMSYSTASMSLALGMQILWAKLGILAKFCKETRNTNFKQDSVIYRLYRTRVETSRKTWLLDENYIYSPVKRVKLVSEFPESVYDITIPEDPTFTASNIAVYDCWWEPNCRSGFACWSKIKEEHILEVAKNMIEGRSTPQPWVINFPGSSTSSTLLEVL